MSNILKPDNPFNREISLYVPKTINLDSNFAIIEEIIDEIKIEEVEEEFIPEEDVFEEDLLATNTLQKAIADAEQIVADAREAATQIILQAEEKCKVEAEKKYNESFAKGEEDGYAEGLRRATEDADKKITLELNNFMERLENEIYEISEEKEKLLEQYLDALKNISIAIGEKIVQTSLKSSKEVIERMILVATEKMKKVSWAKIYIGNSGEGIDISGDTEFLESISHIAESVKIVVIDESEPGTCIVETPDAIMDISVKTQLENIKEILNNARL